MKISPPRSAEDAAWLVLRSSLWPVNSEQEHRHEMAESLRRGDCILVAFDDNGRAVGLVEALQRNDHVNGTESSPVAFLEGLYVEPSARRRGIARALTDAVIAWAASRGYKELASDAPLDNLASQALHRALGFEETERVVYFRKVLRDSRGAGSR